MNIENVSQYVTLDVVYDMDETQHKQVSILLSILAFTLGIILGAPLRSYWIYISLAMCCISLVCAIIVFVVCRNGLTLKSGLWLSTLTCAEWVVGSCIIELMIFTHWKGFSPWFLLSFLPVVFVPLFVGIKIHNALKKTDYTPKNTARYAKIPFGLGALGGGIAAILHTVDPNLLFIAALLSLNLISACLSLKLLSLQKLYYIKKYNISL
ncbi:MAG: hypothetical protein IKC31_03390 [Clostridia bacterium]|nr:hypothetical protein [Clostridia bacterium]